MAENIVDDIVKEEPTVSSQPAPPEILQDGGSEQMTEVPKKMDPLLWLLDKRPMYKRRYVIANDQASNKRWNYFGNYVSTSRYNIITFLPKNLFEQFQRVANIYFVLLLILQLIPQISSLTPITTILPLIFVLGVTLVKDGLDDVFRHISDHKINNRRVKVLEVTREVKEDGSTGPAVGRFTEKAWKQVIVGDIIQLNRDDFIPSDLFIISSSEPNSLCYIETADLDGETNLKVKSALIETAEIENDENELARFDAEFTTEPPNNVLNKFQGYFEWKREDTKEYFAINDDNVLLRGCRVRNTSWVNGLVVFAGPDTKVRQNSGKSRFKRTRLDRDTNYYVLAICIILLTTVTLVTIGNGVWEWLYGRFFHAVGYLPYDPSIVSLDVMATSFTVFLNFFSNLIILNTFIPISLYVSIEIIRLGQSFMISFDHKLYYKPLDTRARARTTTLSEELGNIEYVFSDKTGTLTENIMTFVKCSVRGRLYGFVASDFDDDEDYVLGGQELNLEVPPLPPKLETPDLSWNEYDDPSKPFYDQRLVDAVHRRETDELEFFRALAICHTVLPDSTEEGSPLRYNAQSPDEEALVIAARNMGVVFSERTSNSLTIKVYNKDTEKFEEEVYEVLCILDFDNVRKRMSVIVRLPNGKIRLYCKGADTVIFERNASKSDELKEKIIRQLKLFAKDGLRTLVIAYKDLTKEEYEDWNEIHTQANLSIENRDERLSEAYELVEQDIELLGASAIEDKLQDGVPETIANLSEANIKLWVLTGDKQETAINIGYSAHILTNNMNIFVIEGSNQEEVEIELKKAQASLNSAKKADKQGKFGFVISGSSLKFALQDQLSPILLEVTSSCQAVICCRVTPLQKAKIVKLVKEAKQVVTLAIGDGANDVGMIQSAHIGVGISGREGQQAVLASDYSFAQFRFLERLLLVHGRWSYLRMAKFLRYFFYKNFAFTWCHVWYAFFNGFSANAVFEPYFIALYNIVFTSLPVLLMGIVDQDVTDQYLLKFPRLYIAGQKGLLFNKYSFFFSLFKGALVSLVLYFICFGSFYYSIYQGTGWETDTVYYFFVAITFPLVVIVNLQIGLDMEYWNIWAFVVNIGSILVWFIYVAIITSHSLYRIAPFWINGFAFIHSVQLVLGNTTFWLNSCLAIGVCILPMMVYRFFAREFNPSLADDVQKQMTKDRSSKAAVFIREKLKKQRSPIEAIRYATGYAFSHDRGFGDLITTGRFKQSFYKPKAGTKKEPSS